MSKKCKKCKMVYADHATVCYKCGKPLSNKIYPEDQQDEKRHPFLMSVIVIFTIVAIFSYYGSNSSSNNSSNQASQTNQQYAQQQEPAPQPIDQAIASQFDWRNNDFGVNMESAKKEYGIISVTGKLKAINGKSYSYVQIEFGLYDQNGSKVGSAIDTISNFGSGVTWQFDAKGATSAENVKCVIEKVSGM